MGGLTVIGGCSAGR